VMKSSRTSRRAPMTNRNIISSPFFVVPLVDASTSDGAC
jgi:hypothetical protein